MPLFLARESSVKSVGSSRVGYSLVTVIYVFRHTHAYSDLAFQLYNHPELLFICLHAVAW